jgi:molybdate transport system substrate-binding protein
MTERPLRCDKTRKETAMTKGTLIAFMSALFVFIAVFEISPTEAGEITVSAAISLKNAFEEIGALYESRFHTKVLLNFGASGDLAHQIKRGAPVDVFASAAQKDMNELDRQGLILQGTRSNFAANGVVLIVPAESKTDLGSFEGLRAKENGKIAIGNPKTVPAGRYGKEVLVYYKLLTLLKDRIVYAENVRQVLDYVARGEVDAGIAYATDAAIRTKEVRIAASAPEKSHKPVVYPVAVVRGSNNVTTARAFVAFVLSPDGQRILKEYGFRNP